MAALSTLVLSGKVLDCYSTTASDYDGHQQTTVSGETCLRWDLFTTFSAAHFPDATVYDAANFCRSARYHLIWCYSSGPKTWELCGINKCGDDILTKCGQLSIETPTVLGHNVTFSFTPDTYDSNANIYWQRKSIGATTWFTLDLNDKFVQYQTNKTYHLVLTDSVKHDGEQNYRVHYYNETMRCRMETKNLDLEEPQSLLKILGLQDRKNCTSCIVGEDGEVLMVSCEINDGTRPLHVTMTIGNESYIPLLFNLTTYMAAFILREHHHMENVSFSVLNDGLTSPLKATAQVFVTKKADNEEKHCEKQKHVEQTPNKLIIWIILGSCLLATCIINSVVLFAVIRKRRQNPKDKDRQNWEKEQSLRIIATHSSDVDNVQEHFRHNTRGKDSDEHVFGSDQYTDPDDL